MLDRNWADENALDASGATEFAPAARSSFQELERQTELFVDNQLVALLDSVSDMVFIVNGNRQIVYANQKLRDALGVQDMQILGLRPGELFKCETSATAASGCGTGRDCQYCGAVNSILTSLDGQEAQDSYKLSTFNGDLYSAYDLHVRTSPVTVEGESFVTCLVTDVSSEQRRRALERTFFHDILNTAGGLRGLLGLVQEEVPEDMQSEMQMLHQFSAELVEEIQAHKVLLAAETNDLGVMPQDITVCDVLNSIRNLYASHEVASGKEIVVEASQESSLVTDLTLLRRIIANMVKNALEASPAGERVVLGHENHSDKHVFWVRNVGEIPVEVRSQIFKRSFSTKGSGRGLGTYSMRLLAQNYLQGQVSFVTSREGGTCFKVVLPQRLAM